MTTEMTTPPAATPETTTPPVTTPPVTTPPAEPATPPVIAPAAAVIPAELITPERIIPKANEYKLPEGAPAELGVWANANGLTQEQLEAATTQFSEISTKAKAAEMTALAEAGKAHLVTWGDNAKHNLTLAQRALRQNDPQGTLEKTLNDSGYGNHPAVLEFLFTIGKSMQEGGFLKSMPTKQSGVKTAAQAMYGNAHPSK